MSSDRIVADTDASGRGSRHLVLVTGAGRSGTSTIAGALHHLGLHVPQPVLKSNDSNPMGFFESTWPLWFHRRLMDKAHVEQTDGRPEAVDLMASAVTPEVRRELADWIADVAGECDQLVVKDPRSSWVPWLWAETAHELGIETGFLTMIRHPAEVMGSRSTYYRSNRPGMDDWQFAVMNLCGWINGNLVVERQTRGARRVIVSYENLLEDWRSCLVRVRDAFGLSFTGDIGSGRKHPVDDFIDPRLRRHEPTWEGWDLPADLVEIAQGVFEAMVALAAHGAGDARASHQLDALTTRYGTLVREAQAIAHDTTLSASKVAASQAVVEYQQRLAGQSAWHRIYARLRRGLR